LMSPFVACAWEAMEEEKRRLVVSTERRIVNVGVGVSCCRDGDGLICSCCGYFRMARFTKDRLVNLGGEMGAFAAAVGRLIGTRMWKGRAYFSASAIA
jgi:hypothetical protein